MNVNAKVNGQTITWSGGEPAIVADSIGFVEFMFEFSDDWKTYDKVAQFKHGGKTYNMLLSEDKCLLPAEVKSGICSVSVFGYIAGSAERGTTTELIFYVTPSGFDPDGSTPIPPTPDLYAQLLDTISNEHIADAVYEYLTKNPPPKGEKGDKGDKGERGEQGAPGKDGVDGVDGKDGRDGVDLKAYVTPTASGAIASFDDGAEDIPVKSLLVDIEPVQDLNGYDAPWPPGGGKNLIASSFWYTTGIAIYSTALFMEIEGDLAPSAEYTLSFEAPSGYKYYLNEHLFDYVAFTTKENRTIVHCKTLSSIDKSSASQYVPGYGWAILKNNADQPGNINFTNLQLEIGSTATTYAPYSNICPISGWTGAKVQRTGKNLFNKNASTILTRNTEWTNTGIDFTGTDRLVGILVNYLKPNTQYTISYVPNKTVRIGMSTVSYLNYELGYVYTNAGEKGSLVFTTPDDVSNLTIGFYDTTVEPYTVSEIQIEAGGTSTDYEPYQGDTYDISFPDAAGTVYGGTLDVTSGVLTVDRAYIELDGSADESWALSIIPSGVRFDFFKTDLGAKPYALGVKPKITSNKYLSITGVQSYNGASDGISLGNNVTYGFFVNDSRFTDVESFRASLNNAPLQVVYELATPLTYQLTPTEVNTLLGANNIWADTGDVDVTYRADPTLIYNKLTAAIAALSTNLADADAALNELGVI